jgi:hypothetical protein
MKTLLTRTAALCALVLLSLPVHAQRVRYDTNGQADVLAERLLLVEAAVVRDITGKPSGSMGQVVFFRPDRPAANAGEVRVSESGTELHPLPGGSWFVALVPAGLHSYQVDGERIDLDVRGGRSYFVRCAGADTRVRLSESNAMVFLNAANSRPLPTM